MRYEEYEATVSNEILDLGQTEVNGGGWERIEIKNTGTESWHIKSISELNDFRLEHLAVGSVNRSHSITKTDEKEIIV